MKARIKYLNDPEEIYLSGVYKLWHEAKPEVIYVGSSGRSGFKKGQTGFHQRFTIHISHLRRNKHHSPYLQRIVNKYGLDGLWMEIIEITSKERAVEREQYYMDILSPSLNAAPIAGSSLGYRHTDEAKNLMSAQRIGRRVSEDQRRKKSKTMKGRRPVNLTYLHSPEIRKKAAFANIGHKPYPNQLAATSKRVYQFDLAGNFIQSYSSCGEAAKNIGIERSAISGCASGRSKTSGGFFWSYSLSRLSKENKTV